MSNYQHYADPVKDIGVLEELKVITALLKQILDEARKGNYKL